MMAETFTILKPFGLAQKENIVSSLADFLALSCCVGKMQSGLQCVTHTAVGRHNHSCLSKLGPSYFLQALKCKCRMCNISA